MAPSPPPTGVISSREAFILEEARLIKQQRSNFKQNQTTNTLKKRRQATTKSEAWAKSKLKKASQRKTKTPTQEAKRQASINYWSAQTIKFTGRRRALTKLIRSVKAKLKRGRGKAAENRRTRDQAAASIKEKDKTTYIRWEVVVKNETKEALNESEQNDYWYGAASIPGVHPLSAMKSMTIPHTVQGMQAALKAGYKQGIYKDKPITSSGRYWIYFRWALKRKTRTYGTVDVDFNPLKI